MLFLYIIPSLCLLQSLLFSLILVTVFSSFSWLSLSLSVCLSVSVVVKHKLRSYVNEFPFIHWRTASPSPGAMNHFCLILKCLRWRRRWRHHEGRATTECCWCVGHRLASPQSAVTRTVSVPILRSVRSHLPRKPLIPTRSPTNPLATRIFFCT